MNKIVVFLAGVALSFFSSLSCHGQAVQLVVEQVENEGKVPGKTYRLYAQLTAADDRVLVLFGDSLNPLIIKSSKPFYQSDLGGGMAKDSNRKMVQSNDSLRYDSWITIGGEDNYECNINVLNLDLTGFEKEGGPIQVLKDGAWFTLPTDKISTGGDDKKVLLGQFTTKGTFEGEMCVMGTKANGEAYTQKGLKFKAGK